MIVASPNSGQVLPEDYLKAEQNSFQPDASASSDRDGCSAS
jgi:hypothetical protein